VISTHKKLLLLLLWFQVGVSLEFNNATRLSTFTVLKHQHIRKLRLIISSFSVLTSSFSVLKHQHIRQLGAHHNLECNQCLYFITFLQNASFDAHPKCSFTITILKCMPITLVLILINFCERKVNVVVAIITKVVFLILVDVECCY